MIKRKKLLISVLFILLMVAAFIHWNLSHPQTLPLDSVESITIMNGTSGNQMELADDETETFIDDLLSFEFKKPKKNKEKAAGWSVRAILNTKDGTEDMQKNGENIVKQSFETAFFNGEN